MGRRAAARLRRDRGVGEHPAFGRLLHALEAEGGFDFDLDAVFELGLRTLLDGLAVLAGRR